MNKIPINIWVNEQRYQKLCQASLESMTREVLVGMKVLQVFCSEEHKDVLLKKFTLAKYDQSMTKSIELLPAEFKDNLFNIIIERKSLDVIQGIVL